MNPSSNILLPSQGKHHQPAITLGVMGLDLKTYIAAQAMTGLLSSLTPGTEIDENLGEAIADASYMFAEKLVEVSRDR